MELVTAVTLWLVTNHAYVPVKTEAREKIAVAVAPAIFNLVRVLLE